MIIPQQQHGFPVKEDVLGQSETDIPLEQKSFFFLKENEVGFLFVLFFVSLVGLQHLRSNPSFPHARAELGPQARKKS